MGVYIDAINRNRIGMSPESIHQAKCARKRARTLARKSYNKMVARYAEMERPSPEEQLKRLDFRLGKGEGAKRERLKLLTRIENRSRPPEQPASEAQSEKKAKKQKRAKKGRD